MSNETKAYGIATLFIFLLFGVVMWFAASQEAKAFNRCTGSDVTTWEAVFANYRIESCNP